MEHNGNQYQQEKRTYFLSIAYGSAISRKNTARHCFNAAMYTTYVPIEKKINRLSAGLTEYLLHNLTTAKLHKNAGKKK